MRRRTKGKGEEKRKGRGGGTATRETGGRATRGGGAGGWGRPPQVGPTCRRLREREGGKRALVGRRGPKAGNWAATRKRKRGRGGWAGPAWGKGKQFVFVFLFFFFSFFFKSISNQFSNHF
jgi:hypothetical protein